MLCVVCRAGQCLMLLLYYVACPCIYIVSWTEFSVCTMSLMRERERERERERVRDREGGGGIRPVLFIKCTIWSV